MVLIKKYDYILIQESNYFFTLDDAANFVEDYRINLLNSISNETV